MSGGAMEGFPILVSQSAGGDDSEIPREGTYNHIDLKNPTGVGTTSPASIVRMSPHELLITPLELNDGQRDTRTAIFCRSLHIFSNVCLIRHY